MAEFCLDCFNKFISTHTMSENEVELSSGVDVCEGCGNVKHIVLRERKWNKIMGDETLVLVPDKVGATHLNFFDDIEYECWNLFKQYLGAFGIKLVSDDIDFYISKKIQDTILNLLKQDDIHIDL